MLGAGKPSPCDKPRRLLKLSLPKTTCWFGPQPFPSYAAGRCPGDGGGLVLTPKMRLDSVTEDIVATLRPFSTGERQSTRRPGRSSWRRKWRSIKV